MFEPGDKNFISHSSAVETRDRMESTAAVVYKGIKFQSFGKSKTPGVDYCQCLCHHGHFISIYIYRQRLFWAMWDPCKTSTAHGFWTFLLGFHSIGFSSCLRVDRATCESEYLVVTSVSSATLRRQQQKICRKLERNSWLAQL